MTPPLLSLLQIIISLYGPTKSVLMLEDNILAVYVFRGHLSPHKLVHVLHGKPKCQMSLIFFHA